MSPGTENESEILLGNKQLLLVFGVVAVLLAISFLGGFMVGKRSSEKGAPAAIAAEGPVGENGGPSTHIVPPLATTPDASEPKENSRDDKPAVETPATPASHEGELPLGARKSATAHQLPTEQPGPGETIGFQPQPGQTFLQLMAVGRDEADGVAEVLHKKGFRAHSVQKPGNPKLYRVLIGPLRDASDLANTRDELRKTGFREVITQHY